MVHPRKSGRRPDSAKRKLFDETPRSSTCKFDKNKVQKLADVLVKNANSRFTDEELNLTLALGGK